MAPVSHIHQDMSRELHAMRIANDYDSPLHAPLLSEGSTPVPRPLSDGRRASIQTVPNPAFARPMPRTEQRYGSVGAAGSSPSMRTYPPPALPRFSSITQPPPRPSLASSPLIGNSMNNLSRRHTSGDIRSHWDENDPNQPHPDSSFRSSPPPDVSQAPGSAPFPSSPKRPGLSNPFAHPDLPSGGDSHVRQSLSSFSFQSARANSSAQQQQQQPVSPSQKPTSSSGHLAPPSESSWNLPPPVRGSFNSNVFGGGGKGGGGGGSTSQNSSGPPTRRGSMANIYSLLNPSDTAERRGSDDAGAADDSPTNGGDEARKRKRLV